MITPPPVGGLLRGLWSVVSLKHLLLACLCAAALGPHFTYRVPGRFLPLLLPLVGLALGVVQVAMVLRYALGRVLGAPIALIVRAERVATLTAVGFVTYSVAMAANGAWSTLPAREHRSEVLGIVRREVDVGTVLSGVAWVELRSWRATGAIERVPLLWSEERVLWPGKAVLVKVNEERQKLITLDQRLMIGVRDTRHSSDYYPVLVPRSRSYGDEDFKGTFDTSADTSEDYTYVVDCAGTKVDIISREGEA